MSEETKAIEVLSKLVAESCNWRVVWFAARMQEVVESHRRQGKSGWEDMTDAQILHRIRQETKELAKAKTGTDKVLEAVDVANFAMFFAMRYVDRDGGVDA